MKLTKQEKEEIVKDIAMIVSMSGGKKNTSVAKEILNYFIEIDFDKLGSK